jgi:hypothetical protein
MQARAVTKKSYEVMMGLPEDVPADSIFLDEDNVERNFASPRFKGKCYNCGKIGHRKMECRATKQTNERVNTAVDGRNNGRRQQDQDDMVLMAVNVDDYDVCPMAIDSVTTQDSHEIKDLFFDRFTDESDNDYDDSYDSTLFEYKEYDIVSMINDLDELQDQVFHEWGMITRDETILKLVEENPDPGSKTEDS